MDLIIKFADGFMSLFKTGGETFISWMTGIVGCLNATCRNECAHCLNW